MTLQSKTLLANFPDINVIFSFCVPGHKFEKSSKSLLSSNREFIFSSRGWSIFNLVLNRYAEKLSMELINLLIARKEKLKKTLTLLNVVNDNDRMEIMKTLLLDVGIHDLEDLEILADAIWIKNKYNCEYITFWTYDEKHILSKKEILKNNFNVIAEKPIYVI
ncbi:MAG: hypothetical protein ACE5J3_13890 [Methanosarcinales archaeon]